MATTTHWRESPHAAGKGRIRLAFATVIAVGAMASLLSWYSLTELEKRCVACRFDRAVDERTLRTRELFDRAMEDLRFVAALFDSSEEVSREAFHRFCGTILQHENHPALALQWLPRISDDERPRHEAAMEKLGYDILTRPMHQSRVFGIANRKLEIAFAPTRAFFAEDQKWVRWAIPVIGLSVTALLVFCVQVLHRREASVRNLVAARTVELHELNEKLQATAGVQQAILNSAELSIISTDSQGVFRTFNAAAERLLGYKAEELIGRHTPDLIHVRDEVQAQARTLSEQLGREIAPGFEVFVAKARTGLRDENEWTYVRKDQSTFPVLLSITAIRDQQGRVTGFLGIGRDLSERQRADAQLRKLWQAVEQSPETVVITDTKGVIEYVNPKFVEVTGYSMQEAMGQNPRVLKSGAHPPEFYRAMWEMLMAGNVWYGELCNRRKNGELYWESAAIAPVRNVRGEVTNFVAIKEDITERRQAAEELRRAKDEAEQANRAKSQFLAHMSHEIRTPLNGVIGLTDLLLGTALTDKQRGYAQLVKSSGASLLALINDILDFSKIEAGKLELETMDFDLRAVIEAVMEMLMPNAAVKGLELGYHCSLRVPSQVRGDPDRLRQILVNLINNAIKFTETGGIIVRVTAEPAAPGNSAIRFAVTDTGVGIPQDRLDRLFRSFTQVDASTTRKYGGTGLGLAISRQLAELMGGAIGVESTLGQGSTFWFTVRLRNQSANSPLRVFHGVDIRGTRVLVVDDNAVQREVLLAQLSGWGLGAVAVSGSQEAMDALKQADLAGKPFNVAILDKDMPEQGGLELARGIRTAEAGRSTALLLLVPLGKEMDGPELRALGFSGQLVKPVRHSQLFDELMIAIAPKTSLRPKKPELPAHTVAPAAKSGAARIVRVLVAEDNPINQMVASEILTQLGYQCDIVSNGREAVEAVARDRFDVVLMDCQMPEMDGFDATAAIRRTEAGDGGADHRRLPIIALTANAVKGDEARCLEAGMDAYCSKPVDPERLVETIERVLAQSSRAVPAPSPERPVPETAPLMAFDLDALVDRCQSNLTTVSLILTEFEKQATNDVETLAGMLQHGETEQAARVAHSLKGAAGVLSAVRMAEAAAQLEQQCRDGVLDHTEECVTQLRDQLQQYVACLPEARAQLLARRAPRSL